jgi:cell division protein FtsZ
VKAIMSERGMAMMGIGIGEGDRRATDAAHQAISSPLLEDIDISGAKGVLVNITGSSNMTMEDFDEVSRVIHEKVHDDANIIIGLVINEEMGDRIKVTAIATGFGTVFEKGRRPEEIRQVLTPAPAKVDRDLPTFIRERQREVRTFSRPAMDEEEYDIPTFLRKRVD